MPQPDVIYSTPADQVSTDVYTDLLWRTPDGVNLAAIIRNLHKGDGNLLLRNTGANGVNRQILGANRLDAPIAEWVVIQGITPVTAGANLSTVFSWLNATSLPYAFLRVQIRAQTLGFQGAIRGDFRIAQPRR